MKVILRLSQCDKIILEVKNPGRGVVSDSVDMVPRLPSYCSQVYTKSSLLLTIFVSSPHQLLYFPFSWVLYPSGLPSVEHTFQQYFKTHIPPRETHLDSILVTEVRRPSEPDPPEFCFGLSTWSICSGGRLPYYTSVSVLNVYRTEGPYSQLSYC